MNDAIKDYLEGRSETGLLLKGRKGLSMMDDAITVSSVLLGVKEEQVKKHPDFLYVFSDKKMLTVDDAMEILSKAELKPSVSEKTVVLIDGFDKFNTAAQNKLLKLIEDGSIVVIGVAYGDMIATIESRMVVVNYEPLSKTAFKAYCEKKGLADGDILYYISDGVPSDVEPSLLEKFKGVKGAVMSDKPENLLAVLNFVKEKDSASFFVTNNEYISQLFSYLSYLAKLKFDAEQIDCDKYEKLLVSVRNSRERCKQTTYTKDDFFLGIISFVELLK